MTVRTVGDKNENQLADWLISLALLARSRLRKRLEYSVGLAQKPVNERFGFTERHCRASELVFVRLGGGKRLARGRTSDWCPQT